MISEPSLAYVHCVEEESILLVLNFLMLSSNMLCVRQSTHRELASRVYRLIHMMLELDPSVFLGLPNVRLLCYVVNAPNVQS